MRNVLLPALSAALAPRLAALLLLVAVPASFLNPLARAAATGAPPSAPLVTAAGVTAPNVLAISPLLVTAGQPTRESLQRLKAEGFDAVISFAPGNTPDAIPDQAEILEGQGIEFVHIPIPWATPATRHLTETAEAMRRLQGKKVLVHCQMNMRASAVTFLYRSIYAKEDPAAAWLDVKKLWTPSEPWATFIRTELAENGFAFQPE
jgi:protein tyrosine phosphatase (PTP) superfamily phosphohydrolase (DUF442 family)